MGELVSSGQLLYLRYADDILLGFQNKESIPRLTRVFAETLKDLELQAKSEKIWRHEQRHSSAMRVLEIICSITPEGKISARAPFGKWEKKLSLDRIEKKIDSADAPKTLAIFFSFLLSPYLYFFFSCPCAQTEREIRSFFWRRRSLEFLRRFNPSDGKEYKRLLTQYEKQILDQVSKAREHMSKKNEIS